MVKYQSLSCDNYHQQLTFHNQSYQENPQTIRLQKRERLKDHNLALIEQHNQIPNKQVYTHLLQHQIDLKNQKKEILHQYRHHLGNQFQSHLQKMPSFLVILEGLTQKFHQPHLNLLLSTESRLFLGHLSHQTTIMMPHVLASQNRPLVLYFQKNIDH